MIKNLYFKKKDALKAAKDHLRIYGGYAINALADDSTNFDYEDERMKKMCWSGELNAVAVNDCSDGNDGLFAWWED